MYAKPKNIFPGPCCAEELPDRLSRWSFGHAVLMLWGTAISWAAQTPWVLSFFGAGSFLLIIFVARSRWTATGEFGAANTITAFRLAGVLCFPLIFATFDRILVTAIGFVLLALDGLDGWLARRRNQSSEFGEYFDKETDAFFLLILCMLAVLTQRLWAWILILGLLRYLFVIIIHLFRPHLPRERRTSRARTIYGLVMVAILGSFLPYPTLYKPLAVMASMGLGLSFMADFYLGFSRD
jgi:phosphatidylglycerophosphate synthase